MVIAQRGTGSVTTNGSFPVDRWTTFNTVGTVTYQQSSVAPSGFINSIVATVSATGSYSTSGYTMIGQYVEGQNIVDLGYGTASAQQIVVSFWVRSSVTGTYSVAIQNNAQNRSYVSTYVISAANTWEQKFVYIPGDTSGTWLTDNGLGLRLWFALGFGTSFETASPNTWVGVNAYSTSSCVDFAANSGATFYLSGVQLERNYQPTPFEQRPIGVELALCQRYYWRNGNQPFMPMVLMTAISATTLVGQIQFPVRMRAQPTVQSSGSMSAAVLLDRWTNDQVMVYSTVTGRTTGYSERNYETSGAGTAYIEIACEL